MCGSGPDARVFGLVDPNQKGPIISKLLVTMADLYNFIGGLPGEVQLVTKCEMQAQF